MKNKTFEEQLEELNVIIEKLENGELDLESSIKEYEQAMKIIAKLSGQLSEIEGKIHRISQKNGVIDIEEL